jgi:plasmid stabilization system protein ParE
MPRGSKEKYTEKQKRKAEHIEAGYEEKGVPEKEAEARAWATVNKQSGGGERGGSGEDKSDEEKEKSRERSAKRAAASRKGVPREESLKMETKDELMKKARARNIPGRSSMGKQDLIEALKNAP